MTISLKWQNPNLSSAEILVFRSTSPIDQAAPSEPLARLAGDANQYLDTTAQYGTEYHYAIAATRGGDIVFAPQRSIEMLRYRGPGPQQLIAGNSRLGYYGIVNRRLLPSLITPSSALSSSSVSYLNGLNFHKLIRKGKIIFIPEAPIINHISSSFYRAKSGIWKTDHGFCGEAEWAFDNSDWPDFGKKLTMEFGADTYDVRLMRGFRDDWDGINDDVAQAVDPETEFNEIMGMILGNNYIHHPIGSQVVFKNSAIGTCQTVVAEWNRSESKQLTRFSNTWSITGNIAYSNTQASFEASSWVDGSLSDGVQPGNGNGVIWPILVLKD